MSLPSVLEVQSLKTEQTMDIKTEVLDPITISDTEAVFQVPKNGILSGGSFVSLAVRTPAGVSDAFLPLDTGIFSLVKSAHLMVGSKEIASCEDCGHYERMVSKFEVPEHRALVESVKSGRCMDRFVELDTATGRIMPLDLDYTTFAADNTARAVVPPNLKPTDDDSTTPVFSVPLSKLLPMMKSRDLPLYLMKENVFLRLVFNTQSTRAEGTICCFPQGSASSAAVVPSRVNIKFVSDHLYYDDGTMEQMRAQSMSNGLSYLYEDSILTIAQIPASANPTAPAVSEQKVERDIAVSGRVVRSLLVAERFSTTTDNPAHLYLGAYVSNDLHTDTSYNFRVNEQRVYDRDVVKPSHKYSELSMVFASPLQVPSQLYSFDVDSDKSRADQLPNQNSVFIGGVEGHILPNATNVDRSNDLRGTSHYVGIDFTTSGVNTLGNGKQISSKPIIISKTLKRTNGRQQAREMRIYASIERLFTIRNGDVVVSA